MAREYNAVVTSLPALQDISSMSVLCSDKTGTLTTANIAIHGESVWLNSGFSKEDLALFGALASNRDKKEDPIDRSVINHFDKVYGATGMQACADYEKVRLVGFNPIYKRVVAEFKHPRYGTVTIAKGLPSKLINTADGGVDDALDQWAVENHELLASTVNDVDKRFSKAGYKTLAVAIKIGDGPFKFVGILPMLDPPRHDTPQVLCCVVIQCTALPCIALLCTVLYCTELYYTILYYTILYYTILYYTILYCTVLYLI